ncbi:hypothetical protein FNH04_02055 [Streptomyces phyllanthi]|uniref:Uncharacterized protein n=1 Tax=Streptomyces phyllanthi TaxID=1803180 RepID=A0A5N8VXK8_9ACTN|nr:hypothetical protein [Streptomyces phyllanthi]
MVLPWWCGGRGSAILSGSAAMWVRDRLDGLFTDADFAHWFPIDGRRGLSPAQPALVSVLQLPPRRPRTPWSTSCSRRATRAGRPPGTWAGAQHRAALRGRRALAIFK